MKIHPILFTIILISIRPIVGQNYIWPTGTGRYLSSSFGEYRPGHFHSGIDIKTNYKTGYPVLAIADGYIWRVRTSPFGYGKVLYQKLDDGNMAVYGHLDDFNPLLNAYVRAEQMVNKRYQTDLHFKENEYRVSRGDTIAFSGETGTKYPHLHFEIRDKNNRLVNPLNTNLKIVDYTIPTIKALAVAPINDKSFIGGQVLLQIFPVEYVHKKLFVVRDTVRISGPVGFELKTHDTVRGVPNLYNPYGINLYIDDSLFFNVQYDSFDFEETHMISIDRDYQLNQNGSGNFHRLWYDDFAKNLRFYINSPGSGIVNLPVGLHDIRIEVYDQYMNTSTLQATIVSTLPFRPQIDNFSKQEDSINIQWNHLGTDTVNVFAEWVNFDNDFRANAIVDQQISDSSGFSISVPINVDQDNNILKITLAAQKPYSNSQIYYFNPFYMNNSEPASPVIDFIHYPNTFICRAVFNHIPENPPLFYVQTTSDFIEFASCPVGPKTYYSEAIPLSLFNKILACEWRYNSRPEEIVRIPANFSTVCPGVNIRQTSADSVFTVIFPENAVYDTLVTWIKSTPPSGNNAIPIISDYYTINPTDQPLQSDINLNIKIPQGLDDVQKIGVYMPDKDKWNFIGNKTDLGQTYFTVSTDKMGTIVLLKDTERPVISEIFPGNGGRFRPEDAMYLSAIVKDELSGIKNETFITVTLDGRPIYVEYNAPKDHIRYKFSGPLPSGEHTLTITVTDQADNTSTKSSIFTIM